MVLEDLSFDLNYGACYSQMQCADTRKHFELGSWNCWKLFFSFLFFFFAVQCSKTLGKWTSGSKAIQICRFWLVLLKCILSHLWLFIAACLSMDMLSGRQRSFFFSLTILGQKQLHYWIIFCSMMFNGAIFSKWWGEWGNRAAHRHDVRSMTKSCDL